MNRQHLPLIIAILAILLMAIYGIWFDFGRHAKTNSARFDLGNMEQVIWNVAHGHGFVMTDPYGVNTVSRFAFHADPFLLFLVPLYALWPQTETLILLQVLAVASGGIAVWLIGRRLLTSAWWAALFVVMYAVNPSIQWSLSFDVHAVTFAIPLIMWAAWAVLAKRWWWLLAFSILATLTKEQVGLSMSIFGLYAWFGQRQRRWGMILTVVPILWSLVMLFAVLPHFRPQTVGSTQVYRTELGDTSNSITRALVTSPLDAASKVLTKQNLAYGGQLFTSTGLIGIFSPWWLAAMPDLLINGLSAKPAQHQIIAHYGSNIVPWMLLGSIAAAAWILPRSPRYRGGRYIPMTLAVWLVGWTAYSVWATGPLPFTRHDQRKFVTWANPYAAIIKDWSGKIPTPAAVSVTNNVGSHFARRQNLYSFPLGIEQADYLVVLEHHATPVVATDAEVSAKIAELRVNGDWVVLEQNNDLTILQRRKSS